MLSLLQLASIPHDAIQGHHDISLIALSFFIGSLAASAVFFVTRQLPNYRGSRRFFLLLLGACSLGSGIWASHYSTVFGYTLPFSVEYDILTALVSLLSAILFAAVAIYLIAHSPNRWRISLAALMLTASVVVCHTLSIDSIIVNARLELNNVHIVSSAILCYALVWWSLYIAFLRPNSDFRHHLIAAAILSVAVFMQQVLAMYQSYAVPLSGGIGNYGNENLQIALFIGILTATFLLGSLQFWLRKYIEGDRKPQNNEWRSPKWHVLYYVLAGFTIVSSCTSLYLNFQLNSSLSLSNQTNRYWNEVSYHVSQLEQKYQELRDALPETQRTELLNKADMHLSNIADRLRLDGEHKQLAPLFSQLMRYSTALKDGPLDAAQTQDMQALITRFNETIYHQQRRDYNHFAQYSELYKFVEIIIAAAVGIFILAITLYGQKLAKQVRRNEKAMADAERNAIEANFAKSEFLATMSHEIRTPMNGIVGMADLLANTPLSDKQKAYLDIIQTSSETMLELINDILDFSKIEAGEFHLEIIPFNLRTIAEELASVMAVRSEQNNVEMLVRIAPDMPEWMMGDPTRIRQVLINLIGNAVKFTESGHILTHITLKHKEGDTAFIHCKVEDTGIGIPRDKQNHIFDRFTQADSSSTRKYGGTGLGLAITKKLVTMMQGQLGVHSNLGEGSTFWFELSMPVTVPPKDAYTPKLAPLKNKTILIADSNIHQLVILREILETIHMQVYTAQNTHEVQAALRQEVFDIALYNPDLTESPGKSNDETLIKLTESVGSGVVALVGTTQKEDTDHLRRRGFYTSLAKPVGYKILIETLLRTLHKAGNTQMSQYTEPEQPTDETTDFAVLLVEDNPVNRTVAETMLKKLGCSYHSVETGRQALEHMRDHDYYDLILTDIHMPDMTGIEMAVAVRKEFARHIPIIALTADVTKETADKMEKTGFDGVISKPVKLDRLKAALDKWR